MSDGLHQTSLHNLAHIANMSHELQVLNQQLNDETSSGNKNNNQMSPGASDSNQMKNGKPKRMACVECRQQKSRCDAHEKHPAPCSRCAKKGLQCNLRSDYKRTYKRARIAQIEKEFSELKKKLTTTQAAELLSKVPTLSNDPSLAISSASPQPQLANDRTQLQYQPERSHIQRTQNISESWPSSVSPYNAQYDARFVHDSSETNNSIPNTPSITRPMVQANPPDEKYVPKVEKVIIPEQDLLCEEKRLDDVSLSSEIIKALFVEYVNYYHPILPVVDVSMGPERIYRLCPALFWVIMFVSLRRYHDNSQKSLLIKLSPIVKGILAEITISPITRYNPTVEDEPIMNASSVYSVQAFLLYTYWPPLTSSLSADSSWNTIGVALFQAIRIGLHTPGLLVAHDSKEPKTPQELAMAQEQAKTWIVCNTVSQDVATAFGFPAFVQFDTSIYNSRKSGNGLKIPKSIQFMMEIAHFEDQVAKTLNSNPTDSCGLIDPTERLPLLKILSRQLDELELKVKNDMPADDGFREFQLMTARVHLFTYYFMDSSRIAYFELQKGLVRLYNAAIALINHAQLCQTKTQTFIKYLPGVYILNIWQASCIIGKLSHSSLKNVIDLGSGRHSYLTAISLAAKASILKHDMAHRSSGIMRNMWLLFATLDEKKLTSLSINIRTRMAASVFFDCLYLLRDQVGMIILNSRNEQNQGNDGEEENEGGSCEDEEEYGYADNDEAVASEEEDKSIEESQKASGSQKSTPSSNTSSRTKRQRSLSGTVNAESKARRIIQTIPLDPQPIPVHGNRSSLFMSVDSNSPNNPYKRTRENSNSPQQGTQNMTGTPPYKNATPNSHHDNDQFRRQKIYAEYNHSTKTGSNNEGDQQRMHSYYSNQNTRSNSLRNPNTNIANRSNLDIPLTDMVLNDSPIQGGLENLEIDHLDINTDLLWKDVDSVMNDFGFHTR